jgi:endonuclease/exonuclease/phosphatase family metal-dependent hydrolase
MLIVLIACASGCVSLPPADMTPAATHFSVVTYNINWGCPQAENMLRYLDDCNADILMLQETHAQWERLLRAQLGGRYPHSHFVESGGAGGIAIMSRFPLRSPQILRSDVGWFPALHATAETPLGDISLLNLHLKPPLSNRGRPAWSELLGWRQTHRREIADFFRQLETSPTIIAGDFNEHEDRGGASALRQLGYRHALRGFDRKSDTWFWRVAPGVILNNRYDHILYQHLSCTGAVVTPVAASDHLPVHAVFAK